MSVGDLANNLKKLALDLRALKYPRDIDQSEAMRGDPSVYLPIIHHVFLGSSELLQRHLSESGVDLYVKSDRQFISAVYKLLIMVFRYKPVLSQTQFFDMGYAEHKVLLCLNLIKLCEKKNNDLLRLDAAKRSKKQLIRVTTPTKRVEYEDVEESWSRDIRTNTSGASVRVFESPEMPLRGNSAHKMYAQGAEPPPPVDALPSEGSTASLGLLLRQLSQNHLDMRQDFSLFKSEFDTFRENVSAHLTLLDNQIKMLGKQKSEELLEYAMNRVSKG